MYYLPCRPTAHIIQRETGKVVHELKFALDVFLSRSDNHAVLTIPKVFN